MTLNTNLHRVLIPPLLIWNHTIVIFIVIDSKIILNIFSSTKDFQFSSYYFWITWFWLQFITPRPLSLANSLNMYISLKIIFDFYLQQVLLGKHWKKIYEFILLNTVASGSDMTHCLADPQTPLCHHLSSPKSSLPFNKFKYKYKYKMQVQEQVQAQIQMQIQIQIQIYRIAYLTHRHLSDIPNPTLVETLILFITTCMLLKRYWYPGQKLKLKN